MRYHETEIKLKVLNPRAVQRRLADLGFVILKRRHFERNFLFDFPDSRLRKSSSVIRLRQEGRRSLLTFKGAPHRSLDYKIRPEIETEVADGGHMREILEALGLRETFCYEKFRTIHSPARRRGTPTVGLVMFDETPIGNFLELEGPRRWIDEVARQLGFSRADYISASYVSLYHAKCLDEGQEPGGMVFTARQ